MYTVFQKHIGLLLISIAFTTITTMHAQNDLLKGLSIELENNLIESPVKPTFEVLNWDVSLSIIEQLEQQIAMTSFGVRSFQFTSETEQSVTLGNTINLSNNLAYTCGRDNDILHIQDYIPNTAEFVISGGVELLNTANFSLALNYQWTTELAIAEDPTISFGGPFLTQFAIGYSWNSWSLSLALQHLINKSWDEAQFDIENQELAELQAPEEALFRPEQPFSFMGTLSFTF